MNFVPVFFLTLLIFAVVAPAFARTSSDFKAGIEYAGMPAAVGNGRRSEGWLSFQAGTKWTLTATDRLRLEIKIAGDFLILSPSATTASSQTLGSPQAGEWNKSGSPHYLEDQELFAEYKFGKVRASIGSKTLRWGVADFFDPLDQINSRRMERPASSVKRGEWMIYSEWRGETADANAVAVEAFVIPIKRGVQLPSQTSPWLPRQLYIPNRPEAEFNLPDALEYRYRDREDPESALRWNAGARIAWRPGDNEFSLQYDEGASSFPSIRPTVSGPLIGIRPDGRKVIQSDPLIQLTEVYYRERHYGASLVRPLGSSLLRLQFGKTEPLMSGRNLANDRADLSLAVERQIGLGSFGTMTVLAQAFKNTLEDQSGGTDIASFSKFFDRAVALGIRVAPSETTTLTVGALKSLAPKGGTIIQTNLAFDLNQVVAAELGWTWYEADLDSPIGPFKDNDGGSVKLNASF